MPSFFDKLKKGMDLEEVTEDLLEQEVEEPKPEKKVVKAAAKKKKKVSLAKFTIRKPKVRKPKKLNITEIPILAQEAQEEPEVPEIPETPEIPEEPEVPAEPETPAILEPEEPEEKPEEPPYEAEGQLAVDVYQTEDHFIIQSAIAGVKSDSLDILMEEDMIKVRGQRQKPSTHQGEYVTQECFWGSFSREIELPEEANPNEAKAEFKEGVLTITIPKLNKGKKRKLKIKNI